MELKEKIRAYIKKNLIVFDDDVSFADSDNIFELGLVNSLFAMKLVTFVEREFDIEIENDDLNIGNFKCVDNIAALVEKKTAS